MPRSIQYYRGVNPLLRLGSDILSQKSSKIEAGCGELNAVAATAGRGTRSTIASTV